jgi:hypothetical protein
MKEKLEMDNPQTQLNPLVKQLAEYYQFDIQFDNSEFAQHWVIKSVGDRYNGPSFYWNSTMPFADFLDELKTYFRDTGEYYSH